MILTLEKKKVMELLSDLRKRRVTATKLIKNVMISLGHGATQLSYILHRSVISEYTKIHILKQRSQTSQSVRTSSHTKVLRQLLVT